MLSLDLSGMTSGADTERVSRACTQLIAAYCSAVISRTAVLAPKVTYIPPFSTHQHRGRRRCSKSPWRAGTVLEASARGRATCLGTHGELYRADKLLHGRHPARLQLAVHLQQARSSDVLA